VLLCFLRLAQSARSNTDGAQPERAVLAKTKEAYDQRSDIWSFGLTVLELALGHFPFGDTAIDSDFQILRRIETGERKSERE
jgi:serine/threonine protein kinase